MKKVEKIPPCHREYQFNWKEFWIRVELREDTRLIFLYRKESDDVEEYVGRVGQQQEPHLKVWNTAWFWIRSLSSTNSKEIGLYIELARVIDLVKIKCDSGDAEFEAWITNCLVDKVVSLNQHG